MSIDILMGNLEECKLEHRNRSILTPQLLELSGIGDKKILEKIGVPVQIDLPAVGTNVQEHGMSRLSAGKLGLIRCKRDGLTHRR